MRRTLASAFLLALAIASTPAAPRSMDASRAASAPVVASDPVDAGRPAVHVFRDKDGLPQNAAMTLAVDARQYLWTGTQDGIGIYNGRSWSVVDLPERTLSNFVRSTLIASDGSVWCGRENGGISRLKDGRWTTFAEADGIPPGRVECVVETPGANGEPTVWATTRGGVARFEGGAWRRFTSADGLPDDDARALRLSSVGGSPALYAGTATGFARLDGDRWTALPAPFGPAEPVAVLADASVDGRPELWAGGAGGRLARFDGASWTPVLSPARDGVTCLCETAAPSGRTLWVGTDGGGLLRYERGAWRVFDAKGGMPNNSIWDLLPIDGPSGTTTLWIGTDGGVARMELGRWTSFDTGTGLPANSVYALCETTDADGVRAMWMGTRGGGLARVRVGETKVFTTADGLPSNTVFGMVWATNDDGSRTLWAGSQGGGIARLEGERWVPADVSGLKLATVRQFVERVGDDGRREVWAATGAGLAVCREGRWSLSPISEGLPKAQLFCVTGAPAPGGRRAVWVGLQNGGVARYLDGAWRVWTAANSSLPNDSVLGMLATKDASGRDVLWAGTEGGGAARLRLDDPEATWEVFNDATPVALPNDTVYQIRADARGRLYFFTNRGVARLTPDGAPGRPEFDVYVFRTEDGLPSNEFNGGASYVDPEGRIWGGTPAGAAVYDPSSEVADGGARPLYVERGQLTDGHRLVAAGDSLRYDENNLTFEYALLSYFRERDTRYRTQLVGLDPSPGPWTPDYKTSYTTLPAGHYTFRVWARDYSGAVSGPVDIPFEIRPAPWHTWWAYLLYLLALAGATYLVVWYRLRALSRTNEELELVVADRTAQLAEKVSELEVSERVAHLAKEEALDANRAKSVFLSNMSHELRTPLNAVLGFAQLMERERDLDEEQRENVGVIMRSGEHLLSLINDVLSLSKIEAGKLTLNDKAFDLHLLLRGLEEMLGVRASAKRIRLVFDVAAGVPAHVRGDEGKLRQVLINLLGNAVKFTDEGGVSLRARWADGRASFEVEDTGQGIAPEELDGIFDAFVQSESGRTAKEGTGLGLAISRTFVELMGGELRARSEVGRGTVFAFEVDLPEATAADLPRGPRRVVGLEPGSAAPRVLVADDRWENRVLLAKLLRSVGLEVREAVDGREAVDAWEAWRPEIVWMDIRMPVMSGLEATAEIRRREGAERRCAIVALTASAFEHERGTVLEAGCDDFVTKPYRESTIFEKLAEHAGARFVYEEAAAPEPKAPGATALTRERLAAVPPELVAELHAALVLGNAKEAQFVVDNISLRDAGLADELRKLVKGYQFDEILDLIEAHGLAS